MTARTTAVVQEEDVELLSFPEEFENAQVLTISEVLEILENRDEHSETTEPGQTTAHGDRDNGLGENRDLTFILPLLTRLLRSPNCTNRKRILRLIYPLKRANDMMRLLTTSDEPLIASLDPKRNSELRDVPDPAGFESAGPTVRMRIVLNEMLRVQELAGQTNQTHSLQSSDLFDVRLYLNDIFYCLSALLMRPTAIAVINIIDMCETLLHVRHGPIHIIRLVANMPDRWQEVCQALIAFGEEQDEGTTINEVSEQRAKSLRMMCRLNLSMAFTARSLTLQLCKMPSLTIMITLDHLIQSMSRFKTIQDELMSCDKDSDVSNLNRSFDSAKRELEDSYDSTVAFVTGILLGVEENVRTWFAQYTKLAQQKRIDLSQFTILAQFRSQILDYIQILFADLLEEEHLNVDPESADYSSGDAKISNRKLIRATATLRLFCALRGIGMIKLNQQESGILLRLITCKSASNQISVNFATTAVCTLLVCPSVINNQKEERRAADWLRWLIKESVYSHDDHSSYGKCTISELLLLIAIHFQNNNTNQIAGLICATLGMKLQIKASVAKCKSLFVQEVFNDQMIAEHAVKVPVTKNLDNSMNEFLPIHCIHQLLESRSFSKYQVPIRDWIYKQICESKKPIHRMLPKLIEAYVNSVIISTSNHGPCGTNQPIPEEDIENIFKIRLYSLEVKSEDIIREVISEPPKKRTKKSITTEKTEKSGESNDTKTTGQSVVDVEVAQVLLLLYLLLHEDIRTKKYSELTPADRALVSKYSQDFMMEIPIFYLLQLVRDNRDAFGTVLPDLLKLVASQYPQLCSIQHWLCTEQNESYKSKEIKYGQPTCEPSTHILGNSTTSNCLTNGLSFGRPAGKSRQNIRHQLKTGFETLDKNPLGLAYTIGSILVMPKDQVWTYVDVFVEKWFKLIDLNTESNMEHKKLVQVAIKLWWKFNTVFPRKLWVMTINSLKRIPNSKTSYEVQTLEYSWNELTQDPLIVLRCDSKVFRSPEFLNILLHILSSVLAASKRFLQDQINEQPVSQRELREELKTTLVLAQTSAAIQILLESCSATEEEQAVLNRKDQNLELSEDDLGLLNRFEASVNCICEHLHQVFIADTNLAKLVHFQTYPSELLATTSDKIPSMHICLNFIPELVSQPDLAKQVFFIELTSHLCEKYAITKSLNVAKLCFNIAFTLLQLLPSDKRALFYIPVLPALLRICKVFPILQEDARIILNQIDQVTLAHMASTSSRLGLCSARPFQGLEKMKWREVKQSMKSLNLDEALCLCIQKCLLDLDEMEQNEKHRNINFSAERSPRAQIYNTIFAYGSHVINPAGN